MLPAFHGSFACWFRVRQLSRAWVVLLKRNTSLNFASIQYSGSTPHPVKVANKVKFLGIPYAKKYNLYTLIMVVAGILGGGGVSARRFWNMPRPWNAALHRIELRSWGRPATEKTADWWGFGRPIESMGLAYLYLYTFCHKNQANLGKYTIDATGDDFSSYTGWRWNCKVYYYWNYWTGNRFYFFLRGSSNDIITHFQVPFL